MNYAKERKKIDRALDAFKAICQPGIEQLEGAVLHWDGPKLAVNLKKHIMFKTWDAFTGGPAESLINIARYSMTLWVLTYRKEKVKEGADLNDLFYLFMNECRAALYNKIPVKKGWADPNELSYLLDQLLAKSYEIYVKDDLTKLNSIANYAMMIWNIRFNGDGNGSTNG